ncbi:MAG: bifunctional demethylmenaquinone methyltransferase/2-methoxy-6-polyprenyl-1,4-benzoquinol methylase UbiE [Rhodospirillales bacterium]|nr:bifunctional demethylmenaquinone methyltransferase/2-methoxy-6-polyprenyl-1,4-benzoquinol methylase UbiE [Rhodospirillales bacterium]MCB9995419.1 bifunctional demethylmenaquinone methyltransferase/2-methoxy-6-polyprenyl-1,4-benzoquinol methylase UbiE [Rhodospirillales bacterium]
MMQNPESKWFGEREVEADEKTRLVRGVFDSVAPKYDLMNDLMSGGIHRLWKDRLIRMIRPKPQDHHLDVAGGTGDIAFRIRKEAGPYAGITICDLDENMLNVGRDRAINRGWLDDFNWVTGNAEALPVASESVDVYTIAFGLRNVTRIDDALNEAYRVLKPGGRFFCLEFSHVDEPFLARVYDGYSYTVIPRIGQMVAQDRDSYQYLVESIRKFPTQKQLAQRMKAAGFDYARFTNLSFGIAAIHQGFKA